MKISVFVSGRGSNLNAIINSPELNNKVEVALIISDKAFCPAFEIAKKKSIPYYILGIKQGGMEINELLNLFAKNNIDLIVLAGYLKIIPPEITNRYKNQIINIHPALLPSFGGKGMYGMKVHKAVFDSSCKISGATVHFVDENYDTGKIIAQRCVDISDAQSPEEIAARVLEVEHQLLPAVIKMINENRVWFKNGRVQITN